MKHYVYKITNNLSGKYYVGKRTTKTTIKKDDYMGSGDLIKLAIKKYGLKNFTKEILKEFDTEEEAYNYEAVLVTKSFIEDQRTYNIALGGGTPQSPRVKVRKTVIEYQKEIKKEFSRVFFWVNGRNKEEEKKAVKDFYKSIKSVKNTDEAYERVIEILVRMIDSTNRKVFEYQKNNYGFNREGNLRIGILFLSKSYKSVTQKQLKTA